MSPAATEMDRARVARLLETLRDAPRPAELDVTASVLRRVRTLPVPRSRGPAVPLREFAWAAAASLLLIALGACGLTEALGSRARISPASILDAAHRAGGIIWAAASGLARVVVREFTRAAALFPDAAGWFDGTIVQAAWGAALVCAVVLILTILVVFHETRVRRVRS